EAMRQIAAEQDGASVDRIDIASPGCVETSVDDADVRAARFSIGLDDDSRVIGAIARFRHEKGIDVLIRAMRHLRGDVHLIIAGDGPEEPLLRQLAASNVHFVGYHNDPTVWIHAADVIAIPSRGESFGRLT